MAYTIEIRGLPRTFDEEDLVDLCEDFGTVTEFEVDSRSTKGAVFWVTFEEELAVEEALDNLDRSDIDGYFVRCWAVETNVVEFDQSDEMEDEDDFGAEGDEDYFLSEVAE